MAPAGVSTSSVNEWVQDRRVLAQPWSCRLTLAGSRLCAAQWEEGRNFNIRNSEREENSTEYMFELFGESDVRTPLDVHEENAPSRFQ